MQKLWKFKRKKKRNQKMNLHDFLESMYVVENIKLQKNFSIYIQAKTRAIQQMINAERRVLMWISYPILILEWLAIKLKLKEPIQEVKELIIMENEKN